MSYSYKSFGYYDNWRTEQLTCPTCGWTGTFDQGSTDYESMDLMASHCPKCPSKSSYRLGPLLAMVNFPTIAESERNRDKMTEEERKELDDMQRGRAYFQAVCLREPGQLLDLKANELVLTWDLEESENDKLFTVIRHGENVIWREPAHWENYVRFEEVLGILKRKYGKCLRDLVPTEDSKKYLYGDRHMEPVDAVMQRLRQELQQQGFPDQPLSPPVKSEPLWWKGEPLWWKGEPLWWKAYMKGVNAEKEHRNHEAEDHFVEALKLVVKVVDPDEDLCLIWNDLGALFRKQSRYAIRRSLTKLQPKLEQQRIKLG